MGKPPSTERARRSDTYDRLNAALELLRQNEVSEKELKAWIKPSALRKVEERSAAP